MARAKTGGLGKGLGALFEDAGFNPQPASIIPEQSTNNENKEDKPVIERIKHNEVIIRVGEQPHPMTEEHHILMIEVQTPSCVFQKFLKHDDIPEFKITTDEDPVYARAYCNLHGLWKSED